MLRFRAAEHAKLHPPVLVPKTIEPAVQKKEDQGANDCQFISLLEKGENIDDDDDKSKRGRKKKEEEGDWNERNK